MLAGCLYRRASGRTVLDLSTRTQVKKPPLKLEAFLMIFGRSITLLPLPTLLTFKGTGYFLVLTGGFPPRMLCRESDGPPAPFSILILT